MRSHAAVFMLENESSRCLMKTTLPASLPAWLNTLPDISDIPIAWRPSSPPSQFLTSLYGFSQLILSEPTDFP